MAATPEEPILDAEVVADGHGTAVMAPAETAQLAIRQGSTELIPAANAAERVAIATEIATQLDEVIKKQGMRTQVGKHKVTHPDGSTSWEPKYHVNVEGWQTLALFLGLAVIPHDPKPILDDHGRVKMADYVVEKTFYERGSKASDIRSGQALVDRVESAIVQGVHGFTCRVEVFKDGVLIGAGNGRCDRNEESWRDSQDFALESMAATRAQSRSIAATARWIVTLAGYAPTPAEEMNHKHQPEEAAAPAAPAAPGPVEAPAASPALVAKLRKVLAYLLEDDQDGERVRAVGMALQKDGDGKVRALSARAVAHLGLAVREHQKEMLVSADHQPPAAAAPDASPGPGTTQGLNERAKRDISKTPGSEQPPEEDIPF